LGAATPTEIANTAVPATFEKQAQIEPLKEWERTLK
jgi:hypothetical protein